MNILDRDNGFFIACANSVDHVVTMLHYSEGDMEELFTEQERRSLERGEMIMKPSRVRGQKNFYRDALASSSFPLFR